MLVEVRCCCDPNNLVGLVPEEEGLNAGLQLRELNDGSFAFDSNHDASAVEAIPGFTPADERADHKTWLKNPSKPRPSGPKTWRKR